jgi:hypothetical protein
VNLRASFVAVDVAVVVAVAIAVDAMESLHHVHWMRPPILALLIAVAVTPPRLHAQHACPDPHYRWTAKEETSLSAKAAKSATVTKMLTWDTLDVDKREVFWCKDREKPESTVYSVTGWVRRVRNETDGDWHVEMTQTKSTPDSLCVVVEIPPAADSPMFAAARTALEGLLDTPLTKAVNDFPKPVQVKMVGAAFYDGEHRRGSPNRSLGTAHGRCNQTLWELHPVYWVLKPGG